MMTGELGQGPPRAAWQRAHLFGAACGMVAGAAALLLAWYGASGQRTLAEQIPWITVGVAGSIAAAAGQASFVMFGRRAVGQRVVRLLGDNSRVQAVPTRASRAAARPPAAGGYVVVGGASWYHRAECLLVRGKQHRTVKDPGRRSACVVCAP